MFPIGVAFDGKRPEPRPRGKTVDKLYSNTKGGLDRAPKIAIEPHTPLFGSDTGKDKDYVKVIDADQTLPTKQSLLKESHFQSSEQLSKIDELANQTKQARE